MDPLHWQSLLVKPLSTVTRDCPCLGHLWGHNTDRIIFIHVVPPKVAKTSKEGDITGVICAKLRQCKHGFEAVGCSIDYTKTLRLKIDIIVDNSIQVLS